MPPCNYSMYRYMTFLARLFSKEYRAIEINWSSASSASVACKNLNNGREKSSIGVCGLSCVYCVTLLRLGVFIITVKIMFVIFPLTKFLIRPKLNWVFCFLFCYDEGKSKYFIYFYFLFIKKVCQFKHVFIVI